MKRPRIFAIAYGWVLLNLLGVLAWWQWRATEEVSWGFWLTCVLAGLGLMPVMLIQESAHGEPAPPPEAPPKPERSTIAAAPDADTTRAGRRPGGTMEAVDPGGIPDALAAPIVDPRNPYRGRLRQAVENAVLFAAPAASTTSATVLSLVIGGALFTASLLVSSLLRWPAWLEAELVVLALWAIGVAVFTVMLWHGSKLSDDRQQLGLTWPGGGGVPGLREAITTSHPRDWRPADWSSDGCLLLVVLGVVLTATWVLVELLLPGAFLLLYYVVFAAVGSVVNDRHHCRGRPLRALLWGSLWASLYVAPIAVFVALVGNTLSLAGR